MRTDKSQWTTQITLYFNFILLLVRWFIIVGVSLSEQCIADLMSWHTSQQNLSPSAVPWAGFLHTNTCTTELPEDIWFSWNITFAHLKFMVYGRKQTDIHTTSAHAVNTSVGLAQARPNNYNRFILPVKQFCGQSEIFIAKCLWISDYVVQVW